jgi:hypothetical protein
MIWKYFIIHPIKHLVSLSIEHRHYLKANRKGLTMQYHSLEYDVSKPTHNKWLRYTIFFNIKSIFHLRKQELILAFLPVLLLGFNNKWALGLSFLTFCFSRSIPVWTFTFWTNHRILLSIFSRQPNMTAPFAFVTL